MQYFKNTELANLYHVSEKAVRNWIEAAQNGKLALTLQNTGKKVHIANTVKNKEIMGELVERAKKYKNTRFQKTLVPKAEFYDLFTPEQITDIIVNIQNYRDIPLQYSYFDGGAEYWDKYANRLLNEKSPNTLKSTIELLGSNLNNIDRLVEGHSHVNVIDLGVGNGLPVRGLLAHLLEQKTLRKYTGVDLSKEMIAVQERNFRSWFGDKLEVDSYIRDISYDRLRDILINNYPVGSAKAPVNLVLLLGGTLSNFRVPSDVLRAINNSMGPNDRLIYSLKLDTPSTRHHFDFNVSTKSDTLAENHRLVPDLLNIDESLYTIERQFDAENKVRLIKIRFKLPLTIQLKVASNTRTIELNKGDAVVVWRAWHMTAHDVINQFAENGFDLLQASQTNDHDYLLTISEIKRQIDT